MIGAGIMPDDIVIVRRQRAASSGDIVVALLGDEATVKRLATLDGAPVLRPENAAYQAIRGEFEIAGRVIGLMRAYQGVRG